MKETEVLKKQLTAVQESAKAGRVRALDEANNQFMLPLIPKDDSDGEMDINVSMIPREEGEVTILIITSMPMFDLENF